MKSYLLLTLVGCCLTFSCYSTAAAQQLRRPVVSPRVVTLRPVITSGRRTADVSANWYPFVIARGEDRARIRETPIELRPNRPLHFWGNSRRRGR